MYLQQTFYQVAGNPRNPRPALIRQNFQMEKVPRCSSDAATSLLLNSMIVLCYTNTQFTATSVPLKTEDEVWKKRGKYCSGTCTV